MAQTKPFDLNKLFEGSLSRLRIEAEYFSRSTRHNSELGRLNETHLVQMLRAYLPPKVGVGTGYIACGGPDRRQSPQCDIILFDALNNAPLYKSDAWSIYPIEIVYGVVEVKTNLNANTLQDAFDKCADIRRMAITPDGKGNKSYLIGLPSAPRKPASFKVEQNKLPPRFYVFAYDGWKSARALEANFRKRSEQNANAHIHGVCSLHPKGSFYIQHVAFKPLAERISRVSVNGFRHWLMNLPPTLDSMLPRRRNGLGFDQINLAHYNLGLEQTPSR